MALQGNLKDVPLADLLDLITRNERSGILRLNYTQEINYQATIVIKGDQLHFAWVCKSNTNGIQVCRQGEETIYLLLSLLDASFSYELLPDNYEFPSQNIFSSKREILLASIFNAGTPTVPYLAGVHLASSANPRVAVAVVQPRPISSPLPLSIAYPQPKSGSVNPTEKTKNSAPKVQRGWLSSVIAYIKQL